MIVTQEFGDISGSKLAELTTLVMVGWPAAGFARNVNVPFPLGE